MRVVVHVAANDTIRIISMSKDKQKRISLALDPDILTFFKYKPAKRLANLDKPTLRAIMQQEHLKNDLCQVRREELNNLGIAT